MEIYMMGNGKIIKKKEKGNLNIIMMMNLQAFIKKIKNLQEMVIFIMKMEMFIMDILKME